MSSVQRTSLPSNRRRPKHGPSRVKPSYPSRYGTVSLLLAFVLAASACGGDETSTAPGGSPAPSTTTGATDSSDVAADPPISTDPVGTPETPKPPEGDPTVALEWTQAGLSGETFVDQVLVTDQGFVAHRLDLDDPQAWVSGDGVDWTPTDLVFEGATEEFGGLYEITAGGPGYVALGSTLGDSEQSIWTSDDGFTWNRHALDLEYPDLGVFASVVLESLVGGPAGLVLLGRMDRAEGGPDEHRFFVWTSVDGSAWNLVDDAFPDGAYVGEILPTTNAFVTQGFVDREDNDEGMWWSADGRSWEASNTDSIELALNGGLAVWGDKILAVGETDDGTRLWTSTDGRTWEQLPPSPTLDHTDQVNISVDQVAAGPYGIVLLGELARAPQPLPQVVIEKDDLILTADPETNGVTVTDASTGNVLLDTNLFDPDFVIIDEDDGSVTFLDPDTGEVLITITSEEFNEALDKAMQAAGIDPEFGEEQLTTTVIWFSPDGQRWTSIGIEEVFGTDDFPSEVVVGNDAVLLRFSGWSFEIDDDAEVFGEDPPDVIWVGRLTDEV